jgi:uncharacterized protein YcfJ
MGFLSRKAIALLLMTTPLGWATALPALAQTAPIYPSTNPAVNYYQVLQQQQQQQAQQQRKRNNCTTGAIVGALVGGTTGAVVSKSDARGWTIPTGAVAGGALGCVIAK